MLDQYQDIMTIFDVAEALCIGKNRVYELLEKKELKGFRKVTLAPGEEETVTFEIREEMLRFLTENDRWESEAGEFEAFVGADSSTVNCVKFRLV